MRRLWRPVGVEGVYRNAAFGNFQEPCKESGWVLPQQQSVLGFRFLAKCNYNITILLLLQGGCGTQNIGCCEEQ